MSDGVLVIDFDGHIVYSNQAARELLVLQEESTRNRSYAELFLAEPENDAFNDILFSGIQNRVTQVYREAPFRRSDGQRIELAITSSFLRQDDGSEGSNGVVVVFRDITQSKALDRARRRVVDHLSHELQTPLSIIKGSLKRINQPENAKLVERMEQNLKRLLDIQLAVEDIVKESNVTEEGAPAPITVEPVDMGTYVRNFLPGVRESASHRKVALEEEINCDPKIRIDTEVLGKALTALLKNAIEATPDGGKVTVSLNQAEGRVVLEIRDTGVGITPESEGQIFGGFYHSMATDLYTTKKPFDFGAGGKGLDLLRLKVLSEAHNFHIEWESARCRFIPNETDLCPGAIGACSHVKNTEECARAGNTTFRLIFRVY